MLIQMSNDRLFNLGLAGIIEEANGMRGKWEIVAYIPASSGQGIQQITIKGKLSKEESDKCLSMIHTQMPEFAVADNGMLVNLRQCGIIKTARSVGRDSCDIVAVIPGGIRKSAESPNGREVTMKNGIPLSEAPAYLEMIGEQFSHCFVVPQSHSPKLVNLNRVASIKRYSVWAETGGLLKQYSSTMQLRPHQMASRI